MMILGRVTRFASCLIVLLLSVSSVHAVARASPPPALHLLGVRHVRALCLARPNATRVVYIRGYYVTYPFFGPGPPATPVSIQYGQTGYLFGRKKAYPLNPNARSQGILVYGPHLDSRHTFPPGGWVRIQGQLNCAVPSLIVKTWRSI